MREGPKLATASVNVSVLGVDGAPIEGASVRVRSEGKGKGAEARYDDVSATHTVGDLAAGKATILAAADGMGDQERTVVLHPGANHETFVLGREGLPFYMRGTVRVPFEPQPGLLGVTLQRGGELTDRDADLLRLVDDLGLERVALPEPLEQVSARLFRTADADEEVVGRLAARLNEHPAVLRAGSVVALSEESMSFLTDEIVVRFTADVTEDQVREIAKDHGMELLRSLPYSPNTFHMRSRRAATLELLEMAARLQDREDVEWAEPNLETPVGVDAINPPDFLWAGEWERQQVRAQDAWQLLSDAGLEPFGDPNLLLAVVDHGIESVGGAPAHPDFQGTVSSGANKIAALWDFFGATAVPNNDNPLTNHGMGVAGICTAMATNPAAVPGQTEGLAGAAPNVQALGLILPYNDVGVADAYIWAAGFIPNSPQPGFPAGSGPGVDVFTCSIPFGAGAPLSGTARAMIDFVTTHGRNGKGCLCFFSTGNVGQNIAPTHRPYAAYEKGIAIAATRIGDDGATEQRIASSGWGENIQLSAPSNDEISGGSVVHNPPQRYGTWGADLVGQGNLIGHAAFQTTLSAAVAAGTTTITVADAGGLAAGAQLLLSAPGTPGSEPARVSSVSGATVTLSAGLLNAHAAGTAVMTGPANYTNAFGGTSSATPLAAGVAALVLSAEPDLTWIEARQILRDTAVKLDPGNTDAIAQWLDADGNPSVTSGNPPLRSRGYGYGRVDAAAAVQRALLYGFTRDLVVRDNLADTGAVPSSGAFWSSPDIWVRNLSPASEGGAALPAGYGTAGPHQHAISGQSNWVYARVRNNGTEPSLDAYVRILLTHWPGLEFTYPDSFTPTTRPGTSVPSPMVPGTYVIGEVRISALAAGADQIVNVEWPAGLVPPEEVVVGGTTVHWHPCLLVEISPHDGPAATGNHIWESNNLAQRNITIVYADAPSDFAMSIVAGHQESPHKYVVLEVDRGYLPREVQLYVDLVNPILMRRLRSEVGREEEPVPWVSFHAEPVRGPGAHLPVEPNAGGLAIAAPPRVRFEEKLARPSIFKRPRKGLEFGHHNGREVVLLPPRGTARVPIYAGPGALVPVVVGGIVGDGAAPGEYSITLVQRDPRGGVSGSAEIAVTIRG